MIHHCDSGPFRPVAFLILAVVILAAVAAIVSTLEAVAAIGDKK